MGKSLREMLEEKRQIDAAAKAKPTPEVARTTPHIPTVTAPNSMLSRMAAKPNKTENGAVKSAEIIPEKIALPPEPPIPPIPPIPSTPAITLAFSASTPPDPSADFAELRSNITCISENMEHKTLLGQVIRRIAEQLHDNPQFRSRMVDSDFEIIVAGLRKAYKTAVFKKTESAGKRMAKAEAKSEAQNEISQMMKDFGLEMP